MSIVDMLALLARSDKLRAELEAAAASAEMADVAPLLRELADVAWQATIALQGPILAAMPPGFAEVARGVLGDDEGSSLTRALFGLEP